MSLSFSKPVENATLRVASFGGGLNSTAMLLAAAHGLIEGPLPDVALHAFLHAEGAEAEEHLRFMASGNVLPYPLEIIEGGDLGERVDKAAVLESRNVVPFWVRGRDGREAMLTRGCTRDYKIYPQERRIRELLGYPGRKRVPAGVMVEQWIGIGAEEVFRATPAEKPWITNRWPLIELGWNRQACEAFLRENGYPVPKKSRCVFCPYTSDARWLAIKAEGGEDWERALEVDQSIRGGFLGSTQEAFVHRSLQPLALVDFSANGGADLFNHECKGFCGS